MRKFSILGVLAGQVFWFLPSAFAVNLLPNTTDFIPVNPVNAGNSSLNQSNSDSLQGLTSLTPGSLASVLTDAINNISPTNRVFDDGKPYIWDLGENFDQNLSLDQISIWGASYAVATTNHYNYNGSWQVSSDNSTWYTVGAAKQIKFAINSAYPTHVTYTFAPNTVTGFRFIKYQGTATQSLTETDIFTSLHGPTWGDWDGNWSDVANWNVQNANAIPSSYWPASFANTTSLRTITVDIPSQTKSLTFNSSSGVNLQGNQILTLSNGSLPINLTVNSGEQFLSCPLVIDGNVKITTASNASRLHLVGNPTSNIIQFTPQSSITMNGPGILYIDNSLSIPQLTITSGTVSFMNTAVPSPNAILKIDHLSFSINTEPPLSNFFIYQGIVVLGNADKAEIRNLIQSAYINGTWEGKGINAPKLRDSPHEGLAYLSQSDFLYSHPSGLTGTTLNENDLIISFALIGDVNLDGLVDTADYTQIDSSWLSNKTNCTWADGDFNYDGIINSDDFLLMDTALLYTHSPLAQWAIANDLARFGSSDFLPLLSIPEPATTLSLLPLLSLFLRRRRSLCS